MGFASVIVNGLAFHPLPKSLIASQRAVILRTPMTYPRRNTANAEGAMGQWSVDRDRHRPEDAGGVNRPLIARDVGAAPMGSRNEHGQPGLWPEYRMSITCPNPEEVNSATFVSFQVRVYVTPRWIGTEQGPRHDNGRLEGKKPFSDGASRARSSPRYTSANPAR